MRKSLLKISSIISFVALYPITTFAYPVFGCGVRGDIWDLLCRLHQILNALLPVLVALGVVYLVFGIVQYFIGGGDEAKKKGKDRIIYGLIGLAVIMSIWGLVGIIVRTFGTADQTINSRYLQKLLPQ